MITSLSGCLLYTNLPELLELCPQAHRPDPLPLPLSKPVSCPATSPITPATGPLLAASALAKASNVVDPDPDVSYPDGDWVFMLSLDIGSSAVDVWVAREDFWA